MSIFDLNSTPPAPDAPQPPAAPETAPPLVDPGNRFAGLAHHELLQLLDDMDDERARARRRESFYISTIVYLLIAWFVFYGPQVLFHVPRMINPGDILKNKDLTYLDLPPDALQRLKPRPQPRPFTEKERTTNTPDRKLLDKLRAEEPKPAPQPQPELPAAPQPQPKIDHPLLEEPTPEAPKPSFNPPARSPSETMRQFAENAIPTRPGFGGSYSGGRIPGHGGLGEGVQVLSDTSGADIDPYIKRLLIDLKAHWLPLIPEEANPPLSKKGETLIRFTIAPDGKLTAMNLDDSTHDVAMDHAAWGAVTSMGQFEPLPKGMKDPNLTLRILFMVNEKPDE